jgi:hypothetical protein
MLTQCTTALYLDVSQPLHIKGETYHVLRVQSLLWVGEAGVLVC